MPLLYQPKAGSVVMCDFSGNIIPEMVKVRPVVILAKHPVNSKLVTVIPLSTTAPTKMEPHHHQMSENPLPDKTHITCWAKCDMISTVSLDRLDRYKYGKRPNVTYVVPFIDPTDMNAIKACVTSALKLGSGT